MLPHVMLEKAWKAIDAPEKWCTYHRHNFKTGQRCALGALDTVEDVGLMFESDAFRSACEALVAVIPKDHDWRMPWDSDDDPVHLVAAYNNRCSWEQIRDWWQAAITKARLDHVVKIRDFWQAEIDKACEDHNQSVMDDMVQIRVPA